MVQTQILSPTERRRGVILMVVLILLTLFAIVGLSFALYASSEAQVAQLIREAEVQPRPDAEPELLASFFLGQLIYDTDDFTGVFSALRGHSLARSMYGYYYSRPGAADPDIPNTVPFNGMGRFHTHQATAAGDPLAFMNPFNIDDSQLINYMYYPDDLQPTNPNGPSLKLQPFLRDPERINPPPAQPGSLPPWRTDPSQVPGSYVGGFNAPYTYPDLNNMFLAAVKADGTLLTQSFHRPWLFNSLLEANPNWWGNRFGKYLTLRPRPVDQLTKAQVEAYNLGRPPSQQLPWPLTLERLSPDPQQALLKQQALRNNLIAPLQSRGQLLPYPEDEGGDVKNLVGAPGGNDSIWVDLGFPVMTAPNGQKFKPLFAPLILDLDNRINLNVHGNIRGGTPGARAFVANQGWGPWTVDVSQVLSFTPDPGNPQKPPEEWKQLFYGTTLISDPNESRVGPVQPGRYGVKVLPGGADRSWITPPHLYARVDYDECDSGSGQRTAPVNLQNGTNCFPKYLNGFDDYKPAERADHPSVYNVFQPVAGQRRFPVSDMEALLRFGDTGSPFLTSELLRLCPGNFTGDAGADQRRRLVTLRSFDVERPGATPWVTQFHGGIQSQSESLLPYGGAPAFALPMPPTPQSQQQVLHDPNDFRIARVGTTNQYGTDWRSAAAALGRLDLNRPLPSYPPPGSGNGAFANDSNTLQKVNAAIGARQEFARDIYERLISVTGVYNPYLDPQAHPFDTTKDIPALRSLAQLAVNIVDLIDEDDYSTPFHWGSIGHTTFRNLVENSAQTPQWVFGVELPHVLINEAYAQFSIINETQAGKPHDTKVEVWVELYNPLSRDPTFPPNNGDVHLDSGSGPNRGYRLILARPWTLTPTTSNPTDAYLRRPDNPRGTPRRSSGQQDTGVYYVTQTPTPKPAIVDFVPVGPSLVAPIVRPSEGGPGPQGHFVIGPTATPLPGMPAGSQVYSRPEMTYAIEKEQDLVHTASGFRPPPPTVVLQRLACPYLPHNPLPSDPEFPNGSDPNKPINPYITVDYFADVNNRQTQGSQASQIYIPDANKKPAQGAHSEGRRQPFAGHRVQKVNQTSGPGPHHSFFKQNDGIPANFDWLVHLDRQLISPMELMHVAAVKPAVLTQEFIHTPATGGHMMPFNHRVPWYDEDLPATGSNDSHRLHRLFEFVATRSRAAGLEAPVISGQVVPNTSNSQIRAQRLSWLTSSGVPAAIKPGDVLVIDKAQPDSHEHVRVNRLVPGLSPADIRIELVSPLIKPHGNPITIELTTMGERVPGKINVNTIWDVPTFQAVGNPTSSNNYPPADIQSIFSALLQQRTPGLQQNQLSQNDRPFLGMAAGHYSSQVPFYPPGPTNYGISGVKHTLLGPAQQGGSATSKRLMQVPFTAPPGNATHPFVANQLLTKMFNNVTTRSNVFAVWVTVGFFEVIQDTDSTTGQPIRPVKLGAEIGKAENRQIRHRMFSIVDRTALTVPSAIGLLARDITAPGLQSVQMDRVTNNEIPIGPTPPIGPIDATGRTAPQKMSWTLQPGDVVVVGEGTPNQETVTISAVNLQNRTITADFTRPHASLETKTVSVHVVPGNPGPVARFNPRDRIYEEVVPYLSVIE